MEVLPLQQNNSHAIMEQEHRITYKAGITRSPSDFLCQDGELAECINLTTDSEELKPIVQPAPYITSAWNAPGTIELDMPHFLYIHKFNKEDRYIGWVDDNNPAGFLLVWGSVVNKKFYQKGYFKKPDNTFLRYTSDATLTSVGKTLIIPSYDTIYYFLWTYDSNNNPVYESLGSNFERPKVEFMLSGRNDNKVSKEISCQGMLYYDNKFELVLGKQTDWNNAVYGLYFELRKKVWQKKKFHSSFCVRAALELYDGTYYFISNPVLMVNHFAAHGVAQIRDEGLVLVTMEQFGQELRYRFSQDFSKWSDIIRNVVLFVTREFNLFDTNVDAPVTYNGITGGDPRFYFMSGNAIYSDPKTTTYDDAQGATYTVMESNPDSDLDNTIKDGIYYKLCEIGLSGDGDWHDASDHFDTHTIENLTTQQRLEEDDYYSHCPLRSETMYAYNSRLNLANVSRGFFKGFENFMPFDSGQESTYWFHVTIKTDGGDVVIQNIIQTRQKQGIYFYYPDPRAKHVDIYKGEIGSTQTQILDQDLTEHPSLNGAYYFAGISPAMDEPVSPTIHTTSATVPEPYENLANYVLVSEVNNPFVFKAAGYFKVGTGRILGMSTITQALSQGQFGDFPLLVFSESGIWALSVGSDGYYSSIHPMSREVCINPNNIIQTDGAVFFVSKKGLMVIVGSDVRCVSGQMNGETFDYTGKLSPLARNTDWQALVADCAYLDSFVSYISHVATQMAYDYTDSRLVIFNQLYSHAYIYNIADGTISKTILPMLSGHVIGAVNNYPDYLIQGIVKETVEVEGETFEVEKERVFSFYEKPSEDEVRERSLAFLLTRPMKLAGPVSQASLRQLKNVGTWLRKDSQGNELSCVKTEIYLSEDMQKWYPDGSRFGAAARYYRLALYIKMLPTERLSGTIITSQERRGENMR